MMPLTEGRGNDKVLLGQSYRTPHGAVSVDSGGMMINGEKPKNSEKSLLQYHFIHYEP
jgi:hypothetical protein